MKRTALVLAAAVLGTGCIVVDDDDCSTPSLAVEWTFQLSNGASANCVTAEVAAVNVWLGTQQVASVPCGQGGTTIGGLAQGSYDLTVEGIDFDGRIAYRDVRTVATGECGTRLVSVRPAEGTVNLDYSDVGCTQSPCYLWFSVFDEISGTVAAVIGDTSPLVVKQAFPYPGDVAIRLATGTYTLDWMEQVTSSFSGQAMTCSPVAFDVAAAAETVVPVTLSPACVPL